MIEHHSPNNDTRLPALDCSEGVDSSAAVPCPLEAGGAVVHHWRTLHHAGPNQTDTARFAYILAFRGRPGPTPPSTGTSGTRRSGRPPKCARRHGGVAPFSSEVAGKPPGTCARGWEPSWRESGGDSAVAEETVEELGHAALQFINGVNAVSAAAVPVVMISACSLLALAFYNRLAALVSRLRTLQRECLDYQEKLYGHRHAKEPDKILVRRTEQLIALERSQTGGVLRRASLLQRTLLCMLGGIGIFILCSVTLEISAISGFPELLSIAAAAFFLLATMLIFTGICFAVAEMMRALDPITQESVFVEDLIRRFEEDRLWEEPRDA